MRRLLAPLTRWLDRRIDARIAGRLGNKRLHAGHQQFADAAAADLRAAAALSEAAGDDRRGGNWMGAEVAAVRTDSAAPGRPQALPQRTAPHERQDSDLAGVFGRQPISRMLAIGLTLVLGACAADEIGVRATLSEYGLHGVGVTLAPAFGRPCRYGEPFAAKFTAHDDSGTDVSGYLCATDESALDARIIFDRGGA